MRAPEPQDEERRLAVLKHYQLSDTRPEAVYDAFVRAASAIAQTPVALVTLVDRDRQWFKARLGFERTYVAREGGFCTTAMGEDHPLVINDTLRDARFARNPLVLDDPRFRFYAGFPLRSREGFSLGALAVIDKEPRTLDDWQLRALEELAGALHGVLEDRRNLLQIFDSTYNELFVYDQHANHFTFASQGALNMLGYSMNEMRALQLHDVFPEFGGTRLEMAMRHVRSGRPYTTELDARRKDGAVVPVELHCEIGDQSGGERLAIVAQNVTQRRVAQEQIDILFSAVNVAGDSIIVFEVDDEGTLKVAYANFAFLQQTGYELADVMGESLDFFRKNMPDDPGMQRVRKAIAAGRALKTEVCSYRKDGSSFWNQLTLEPIRGSQGQVTHWVSVERDVTEAIERESHLEDQNVRLMALGRAARSLFGALELRELERRLDAAVREMCGASAAVYVLDSEHSPDPLLLRAHTGHRSITDDSQRRIVVPAGSSYVIDVRRAHPLKPADVTIVELLAQYFAVAAHNASLVAEIEEQRNAVLELNQVKSDLIAMLAHDFKGPLTNILGYADLTSEMGDLNEHQHEYIDAIRRAALRLADLATDTLAMSRLERNEIDLSTEPLDLAQLLREVAEGTNRGQVEIHIESDPPLHGDVRRLRQVFYNLIENAIKYSPNGAPVTIRVFERDGDAAVEITDCGIGIPQKDLARVFDRFSRASNARRMRISGTGFGLFLAHQIVEMHGGRIEVESQEGRGSVFRVLLPLGGQESHARPLRVAVVEAHSEARSFITHALREAGLRTRLVPTAEALLEEDIFETDRIVVDLAAVNMNEELVHKLEAFARAHGAHIVVVGSDPPAFGDAQIIHKPYLMRDLVAAVQSPVTTRPGAA